MGKMGEERVFRHLTGFKKNSEMIKVSFNLSASSNDIEYLKDVCQAFGSRIHISQDGERQKVDILSASINDYDTESIIIQIIEAIQRLPLTSPSQTVKNTILSLDITIVVSDADDTSIPGVLLPAEYISLASEHRIQTAFNLMITSSTRKGFLNSGAYLYIVSNNAFDVSEMNRIAGTSPSVVYQKGRFGRNAIVNLNAWGLEVVSENRLPDYPALMLMQKIQNANELGLYCKENNLESHMDITCYSIPSEPLRFQLEPSFFSFLNELNIRYIDMDFMN